MADRALSIQCPELSHERKPLSSGKESASLQHPATPSNPLSIPLTFESNIGQAKPQIAFLARGPRFSTYLTRSGIDLIPATRPVPGSNPAAVHLQFARSADSPTKLPRRAPKPLTWTGIEKLRAESNYIIGNNPRKWRTHVSHFARAEARGVLPGVDILAYGHDAQLEYDLRVSPGADVEHLRIKLSGSQSMRLNPQGDLLIELGGNQLRMRKPQIYQEISSRELSSEKNGATVAPTRVPMDGSYLLEADGSIGFRVGKRIPDATLVIDPLLTVEYSTFLGGTGDDTAASIALDSTGKIYVGGTTTSASTFGEIATKQNGPGGGSADFFVAKLDPTSTGASSLIYLTFLGGSGNEAGGMIALDKSGNLAIAGTTTSPDFPVTDGSKLTSGSNDMAVAELGPTGATLVYSTLFGGSGAEATQNAGGIAVDQAGEIFVASDTTSTDLPVTTGAFQIANGGGVSDAFLAVFRPVVSGSTTHLKYCTFFGISAQVGVGGVAVDAGGNAYVAGFTSDPGTTFPTLNGYQTIYGGDPFDAFVIKLRPSGTGAADLAYGTFLGGAGLDKALAITVGSSMPATAYITGTTQSTNFPTNGAQAGAQTGLKGTANAFLAAIAQTTNTDGTITTSLAYSTYLGGTQSDSALGIFFAAQNAVYIAGKTTSWDFPWLDNFQPFNGDEDAFIAKFDPTSSGAASLLYATPLAGTAPPGGTAVTDANAIAATNAGAVYVAGRTTASDFPRAAKPSNGLQIICASCQELPPAADAFVLAYQESSTPAPSVSFTALKINFGAQAVGATNVPPLFANVINTGDAPLNISSIAVTGPNSAAFSLIGTDPCIGNQLQPRGSCAFEVSFLPAVVGPQEAFVTVSDDAPGSPQVLAVVAIGSGPFAALSTSNIDFGTQPQGSTSRSQQITIVNEGNQDLHISNLARAGANPNNFGLEADTCGAVPIPSGSQCSVNVVFEPLGIGPSQAEIDVVDDSGGIAGAKQVVTLSGTGVAAAPIVSLSPQLLTFGVQAVATTSGTQSVTLRNLGSTALTLTQIAITGPDAASFAIVPAGTTCPVAGGTVAIASSCVVTLDFAPQSGGSKNASVAFTDNASGSPQLLAVSGSATAPSLSISPSSLNFASQSVGTPSAQQNITIANAGSSAVSINLISFTGANAADFSEKDNCPHSLGASANCVIGLTFQPLSAGNRAASLVIADDAAGNPHSVALTGVATQPLISLSPSSLTFAGQLVGASSSANITVTNSGSGAFLLSSATLSGTNAADFSVNYDACKGTVAPGAACAIQFTFIPLAVGSRLATLTLVDNAPNSPQSVQLTGTATDFAIDPPTLGTTSATVTAGQTATYQLDIQSLNGFAGTITFACAWQSAAPAGAACSVAPATLSVPANAATPFQVNVTTTARTQTARLRTTRTPPPSFPRNYLIAWTARIASLTARPLYARPPAPLRAGLLHARPLAPLLPPLPILSLLPITLALILLLATTRPLKNPPTISKGIGPLSTLGFTLGSTLGFALGFALGFTLGFTLGFADTRLRTRLPAPSTPARILAILLILFSFACGGGSTGSVSTSTGTPAGTYTLTLSASVSSPPPAFSPSISSRAPSSSPSASSPAKSLSPSASSPAPSFSPPSTSAPSLAASFSPPSTSASSRDSVSNQQPSRTLSLGLIVQ